MLIGMMNCFLDGPLVIMFNLGFGFPELLCAHHFASGDIAIIPHYRQAATEKS